jgi:hypothetical protein
MTTATTRQPTCIERRKDLVDSTEEMYLALKERD